MFFEQQGAGQACWISLLRLDIVQPRIRQDSDNTLPQISQCVAVRIKHYHYIDASDNVFWSSPQSQFLNAMDTPCQVGHQAFLSILVIRKDALAADLVRCLI